MKNIFKPTPDSSKTICLLLFFLLSFVQQSHAQRITRQYNNVSFSEALKDLNSRQHKYTINFVYDELEDFKVTKSIRNMSVPNAIMQLIGFYPIRMTQVEDNIMVECTQKSTLRYKGRIVDERGNAAEYATIALLSPIDSTIVGQGVSNENGYFVIPSNYRKVLARITYIGYKTVNRIFNNTEMGIIRLQPKTMTVKGVVVKGKRNTVKVGLNKITVDVAHSYLQYMGKVTDVLGMIPGLTSDLQLLEGGTPTFVLNGRPVSMAELKAIPASQVNKIVVDSNPTVEYSASNKGVVYITTKTALGNTLSTELSNTSIFARNYVDMANVSINEKYKKVSNILTAGFSYLSTTQIDKTTETVFLPQKDIESAKERHTIGNARMFEWFYSMNWEISRQQSFGFQYTGNIGNTHIKEPTWQTMNGTEMTFNQKKRGADYLHSASVNYRNEIDSTRTLSIIADYAQNHSDETGLAATVPAVATASEGKYHIGGTRLSYNSRRKWANVSMGLFFSTMNNKGNYAYNADVETYDTHESLYGAYLSLSRQFSSFYLQGGLRMEADRRKLETGVSGAFTDSTEWKLFPNLVAKKQLTAKSSVGLSVGQTIGRPSFSNLNPGLYYYDAISYKVGNPQLKPNVTTNIKLSYNYGNLLASVAYNRSKDRIVDLPFWTETSVDNKNIKFMPVNFNKSENIVATALYNFSIGPVQVYLTGSFVQPFVKANYLGEEHSWNKASWDINANAQWPLNNHSILVFDAYFDSGGTSTLFDHKSWWTMDLVYILRIMKGKLNLTVAANDIFHTDRANNWTMKYNNIRTTMDTSGDTQRLVVKLSYNFGTLKLDSTKKSASKDFLNRL